jgi:hypothetical protein
LEDSKKVPLTRHDLIKEDHYQMLQTIRKLVQDRGNITKNTQFMIEMMKESVTIEEAMSKIVRKCEFIE